jgi:hypothetical protein
VESRFLGFPCFPCSVISMACFGNACHKITITTEAGCGNRNQLSEPPITFPRAQNSAYWHSPVHMRAIFRQLRVSRTQLSFCC